MPVFYHALFFVFLLLLLNYSLWYLLQKKSDEMFEDGLMELFPEGYSTGAFSTADSGKLLVLTDLLSAIQHVNRTDRYHIFNFCPTSVISFEGFSNNNDYNYLTNLINIDHQVEVTLQTVSCN